MMQWDKTLQTALTIMDKDIKKIKKAGTNSLNRNDAGKLVDYVKVLMALSKDYREQVKSENLVQKSDEELEVLAKKAVLFLEQNKKAKKPKAKDKKDDDK